MTKRILAIAFIFLCTAAAWAILGATVFSRTYGMNSRLKGRVASTWGAQHEQRPPSASYTRSVPKTTVTVEDGKRVERITQEEVPVPLPIETNRIQVALDLDHRQKGLLWYSTYKVNFAGAYTFRNDSGKDQDVRFTWKFPEAHAVYDGLTFSVNDAPVRFTSRQGAADATARILAGQAAVFRVSYRSQGLDRWSYNFGGDVEQVRDFQLSARTNFKEIDFPEDTLSPSSKRETREGWDLAWDYKNLVSGFQIGVTMPEKLQPGPLAGKISFFAPVSLFFFFFLMLIITTLRGIDLHPMNYFFLAGAFFAFHLLLAYLVDHISIHSAFLICSAVSIFLVVSYLRVVIGMRFAALEAGTAQLIYLVLFSYAFFFKGLTGLTITIGSILTLFVVMQMTAKVRWSERFATKPATAVRQ